MYVKYIMRRNSKNNIVNQSRLHTKHGEKVWTNDGDYAKPIRNSLHSTFIH